MQAHISNNSKPIKHLMTLSLNHEYLCHLRVTKEIVHNSPNMKTVTDLVYSDFLVVNSFFHSDHLIVFVVSVRKDGLTL